MPEIHAILKQYYGFDTFRPLQEEIINSVLNNQDTLALLPTGGGKSLCFQIPALAQNGLCLVISPLIALMKDQVANLIKKNIPAMAIYSGMSYKEVDIAIDNCIYGNYKFLYVSPERLQTEIFIERLKKMQLNLIAVDEAHCISQWGYDFRPAYLKIADIRKETEHTPIIALTATATEIVCADIQEKLLFTKKNIFKASYERKNISFIVRKEENKEKKLLEILSTVLGSSIIYVRNRRKTKLISEFLKRNKISAAYYHAGLTHEERNTIQENWVQNKIRIIVCTNAFGMGIDKSNVRLVIHWDIPDSIEAYYQEAGRAGRDGNKSFAGLLFTDHDIENLSESLAIQFPDPSHIKKIYHALGNYFQIPIGSGAGQNFDFDIADFCNHFKLKPLETQHALKILQQQEIIYISDSFSKSSTIYFPINKEEIYKFQVENKAWEPLIKLILRMCPGVFENYVPIKESDLAYHLSIPDKTLLDQLKYLNKNGIIYYEPLKIKPQLVFFSSRVAAENLQLDSTFMHWLKQTAEKRILAITNYAVNKTDCRSTILLRYFGENVGRCGHCDICVERNKLGLNDSEFDKIVKWFKLHLENNPQMPEQLFKLKAPARKEKVMEALSFLSDNNIIEHQHNNFLVWKK